MERYLSEHATLRWTIIFLLLLALLVEGTLIRARLSTAGTVDGGSPMTESPNGFEPGAGPTPTGITLNCRTLVAVNLRTGPSTSFDRLVTLFAETPFTALGRSGDVPWLFIRLQDQREGWLSARDDVTDLIQCEGELQSLPERGPDSAAANEPERQETEVPEPTVTPEPTLTAAAGIRLRVGNGPDLHAAARTFGLRLDGRLDEWGATSAASIGTLVFENPDRPGNWNGPADLNGLVRAAWDANALYFAVQVEDDLIVQESREDRLFRGDAVEFFFDSDLTGDFDIDQYNGDDAQLVFSPGNFSTNPPAAWVYLSPDTGSGAAAFRSAIQVAALRLDNGYSVEVVVPWSGLGVTPAPGSVFGYAVALSDDDSTDGGLQEAQLSTTLQTPFQHPLRWGNLILDP